MLCSNKLQTAYELTACLVNVQEAKYSLTNVMSKLCRHCKPCNMKINSHDSAFRFPMLRCGLINRVLHLWWQCLISEGWAIPNQTSAQCFIILQADASWYRHCKLLYSLTRWRVIYFSWHRKHFLNRLLAVALGKNTLYLSYDFGLRWKRVSDYAMQVKWDPRESNTFYYTKDPMGRMISTLRPLCHSYVA